MMALNIQEANAAAASVQLFLCSGHFCSRLLFFSHTTDTDTDHLSMPVTHLHYDMKCMLTGCLSFCIDIIMHVVV